MERHSEYDEEPVVYCSRCYSLKIKYEEAIDSDCCMECGCSDITSSSIQEWEELYKSRYGHPYAVKTKDPQKSFVFQQSIQQLKTRVFQSPLWRKIIHALYPKFPKYYDKTDSVILLFDRLAKDNRMDDLRILLFNYQHKTQHGREEVKSTPDEGCKKQEGGNSGEEADV